MVSFNFVDIFVDGKQELDLVFQELQVLEGEFYFRFYLFFWEEFVLLVVFI